MFDLLRYLTFPIGVVPGGGFIGVSDFVVSIFPAVSIIVTVLISLVGTLVCGLPKPPPVRQVVEKKKFKRHQNELQWLIYISMFEIACNSLFILCQSDMWYMLSFATEIGYCIWETYFLGRSGRLSIEFLIHHICTWASIPLSLLVDGMDVRVLVQLSLSVAIGNLIICASKLGVEGGIFRKKFAKKFSFFSSILYRLMIPIGNVVWITWCMLRKSPSNGPGWMRLYLTSLWMLLGLNFQFCLHIYRTL